jgi:hypothetical protein
VASGQAYAPSVRAHCETVLRSFYDFHVEAGTGPLVNPFPLDRSRRGGRAHDHHKDRARAHNVYHRRIVGPHQLLNLLYRNLKAEHARMIEG